MTDVKLPYDQAPMLASPSNKIAPKVDDALRILVAGGRHVYDHKFDGIRILAFIENGKVSLRNRNGVDTTYRYPDVVARLADLYPAGSRVFDGEMLCLDPATGKPTFARIAKRDQQSNPAKIAVVAKSHPAMLVVFDLLHLDGHDLRSEALMARLGLLKQESPRFKSDEDYRVALSIVTDDGDALWSAVKDQGLEGLIAKDKLSPYRGGRAPSWVKIKPTFSLSAMVLGYTPGQNGRAGRIGALTLGLIYNGEIKRFGEVGTGMTNRELADLKQRIDAGEMLLVDIEVQNITPEGKPRFPSWRGVRTDISILDCDAKQLLSVPVC